MKVFIQDCIGTYRAYSGAITDREIELSDSQWSEVFRSLYQRPIDRIDFQVSLDLGFRVEVTI